MKTYAISQYLTDAQKQKILSYQWYLRDDNHCLTATYGDPEDEQDCCPLGAATGGGSPPAEILASRLGYRRSTSVEWDDVVGAALEFMQDADDGVIAPQDLAAALGVTE